MALESQELTRDALERQVNERAKKIQETLGPELWKDP
jgi:hypothetical protein